MPMKVPASQRRALWATSSPLGVGPRGWLWKRTIALAWWAAAVRKTMPGPSGSRPGSHSTGSSCAGLGASCSRTRCRTSRRRTRRGAAGGAPGAGVPSRSARRRRAGKASVSICQVPGSLEGNRAGYCARGSLWRAQPRRRSGVSGALGCAGTGPVRHARDIGARGPASAATALRFEGITGGRAEDGEVEGDGVWSSGRPGAVRAPQRDGRLSANRPDKGRTGWSARLTGCRPRGGRCPVELPLRVEVVERVSNRPCCVVRLYYRVRARRRIARGLSEARMFNDLVGALSRAQESARGTADLRHPPRHPPQRRRTGLDSECCFRRHRPSTPRGGQPIAG